MGCETPGDPAGLPQPSSRTAVGWGRPRRRSWPVSVRPGGWWAGGSLVMDDDALFALAADIEGHPDNVAPAVLRRFHRCLLRGRPVPGDDGLTVDPRVSAVAFVPPDPVRRPRWRAGCCRPPCRTQTPRPTPGGPRCSWPRWVGRPELLLDATEDRLHQDYREPAMPATLALVRALRADGLPGRRVRCGAHGPRAHRRVPPGRVASPGARRVGRGTCSASSAEGVRGQRWPGWPAPAACRCRRSVQPAHRDGARLPVRR